MRTTSVPRWNTRLSVMESVLADGSLPCIVLIADSTAQDEVVRQLAEQSAAPVRTILVDSGRSFDTLDVVLLHACAGWRFIIVGSEAAIGRIRSRLMAAGAIDCEVLVVSTEQIDIAAERSRDVFCAHCQAVTSDTAAIDGTVECSACGVELTLYYHYSRRHGAYLGYRADSEDL